MSMAKKEKKKKIRSTDSFDRNFFSPWEEKQQ